ncbi:flagellar biosynthesis anti-sigma factor FlgM [Pulveribacter suum]|uniref:Negative regulator of flagellin synthesis n=1 Tax=Pulveribacter suum TaxID=2116657 RepID=A0A2P1NIE8_9BURK|nr:flagellar biosynthesis anti-sigma factor FlgM [Pulveribacter suum]AVP56848.1 flagellar biosynthesis anti-sigma factor FlgM [Pulveribacter suum]
MKITGNNPELPNARSAQAVAARQQGKAAAPAPAAEAATQGAQRAAAGAGVPLTLSSNVRAVEPGRQAADFDAAKVKAVKAAIENGTFRVDAEAVADKLLANAFETLSRSQG